MRGVGVVEGLLEAWIDVYRRKDSNVVAGGNGIAMSIDKTLEEELILLRTLREW